MILLTKQSVRVSLKLQQIKSTASSFQLLQVYKQLVIINRLRNLFYIRIVQTNSFLNYLKVNKSLSMKAGELASFKSAGQKLSFAK